MTFTSTQAQSERETILTLFNYSDNITAISNYHVSLSVEAVWLAGALTGTFSQDVNNNWSYSASPTDKFILAFNDGTSIEYKFTTFNGYMDEGAEDFLESHSIDFTVFVNNYLNLRIVSTANPNSDKTYYLKKITGTIIYDGETNTLNLEHSSDTFYEIGNGFAFAKYNDLVTGSSTTATKSYALNDQYYVSLAHNSNAGQFVKNTQRWSNSTVGIGGSSYSFNGLNAFWAGGTQFADEANNGFYNEVVDASDWSIEGSILKYNQAYGTIGFNGNIVNGTTGPNLIASLNSGDSFVLHNLLNPTATLVNDDKNLANINYSLNQNYPNPFNPNTNIVFTIPETGVVKINIYNVLGEVVSELVNEYLEAGFHQYQFNASNLTSGIYFIPFRLMDTQK